MLLMCYGGSRFFPASGWKYIIFERMKGLKADTSEYYSTRGKDSVVLYCLKIRKCCVVQVAIVRAEIITLTCVSRLFYVYSVFDCDHVRLYLMLEVYS